VSAGATGKSAEQEQTKNTMPELPEVETIRAGLAGHICGARISGVEVRRRDLRQPVPGNLESEMKGKRILAVTRRAKYLLLHLEGGNVCILHLGMSGRLILRAQGAYPPQKHDHVLLTLEDGREIIFNDARRFGLLLLTREEELLVHPLLRCLGPEPFSPAFSGDYLAQKLRERKGAIKPVLMDQALVVGVGNIYACEALFRAQLHPATPASQCAQKAKQLVNAIRDVLQEAIASGGSTLRDYAKASGESGYFQHKFRVYAREKASCVACHTPIARMVQGGRSTFFCPHCQAANPSPRRKG